MTLGLDCTGDRPALEGATLGVTRDQARALRFDREIAVSAGAGSGKTHTLALRYVALLLDVAWDAVLADSRRPRPDVDAVLVLTFTEKAAAEMASRCHRRLTELVAAARRDRALVDWRYGRGAALIAALEHLLDTFDRARITTFHAFAASLLREYPVESATPPGFRVLDEVEADAVRRDVIEAAWHTLYDERPEDVGPLLAAFGSRARAEEALVALLDRFSKVEPRLVALERGEDTVDALIAAAPLSPTDAARWLTDTGAPWLASVRSALGDQATAAVAAELDHLLDRARAPSADPLRRYAAYREVLAFAVRDGKGRALTHYTVMGRKGDWPALRYIDAKAALEAASHEASSWVARADAASLLPIPADAAHLDLLGRLARLALDVARRLREAHDRLGVVDFAGLQDRAVRAVVGSRDLQRRLQTRFRRVMVDEFQDTDAGQWSLVHALTRPERGPRDRLFFVGDRKQAIYGFRGGDVTVFTDAAHGLAGEVVPLATNFRSGPGLIAWVNALFEGIFGAPAPERPAWEAWHEPMDAAPERRGGAVEWVRVPASKRAAETALAQADVVARIIAGELLDPTGRARDQRLWDVDHHPTPPIAILLRTRTHLAAYEHHLRRVGVPYVVAKGVGFWARPEIRDLVNLLDAVDRAAPIAVVGALRGALLAVPDDEITLALAGRPERARAIARGIAGSDASDALRDAASTLGRLTALRDRLPASRLIEAAISETDAAYVWSLDDPHGQAEANARRLVALATAFDARGDEGFPALVAHCRRMVDDEAPDAEAAVERGDARVVLMTIHASKGLEFPVVIVPGLDATGRPASDAALVADLDGVTRIACNVSDPAPRPVGPGLPALETRVRPALREAVMRQKTAEEAAEARRLLYVAVTRAEERLILVGPDRPPARSFGAILDEARPLSFGPADGVWARAASEVVAVPDAPPPRPHLALAPEATPTPPGPPLELSPSDLDAAAECPARWRLGRMLGIPEDPLAPSRIAAHRAAVRGRVVHAALQDGVTDPAALERRSRAASRAAGLPDDDDEARAVVAHVAATSQDPEVIRLLSAPALVEQSIRVPHGDVVVRGQLDRLVRDGDDWVVVDWKSEHPGPSLLDAAMRHRAQLAAYAWAAGAALGARVERAVVVFTGVGQAVPLVDLDVDGVPAALARVRDLARRDLTDVVQDAISDERPCDRCGFRGRACPGRDRG